MKPGTTGWAGRIAAAGLLAVLIGSTFVVAQAPAPHPVVQQLPATEVMPQPRMLEPKAVVLPPDFACTDPAAVGQRPSPPGAMPKPSAQVVKEYSQFVERTVDPEISLELFVGISKLLVFKTAPKRIQIDGDDKGSVKGLTIQTDKVNATIVSEKELALVGKKVGRIVMNLWFADPKDDKKERILSYLILVVPDQAELERLREQEAAARERALLSAREWQQRFYKNLQLSINRAFPDSLVCLTVVGDNLIVSGQAHDAFEATQILSMVQPRTATQTNPAGQALGILTQHGLAQTRTTILPPPPDDAEPQDQVGPDKQPNGVKQLPDAEGPTKVIPPDLRQRQSQLNLVNQLRIPGEQQVVLKVTVAEVNRTAARSIGVNFAVKNNSGALVFSNNTGNLLSGGSGGSGASIGDLGAGINTLANMLASFDGGNVLAAINALRTLNLARSWAEPNLTTLNGRTARFMAGGELPVPVVTGFTAAGLQGVAFVPFGVQLSFTPAITDKDRIRLQVTADVSVRDTNTGATVNGTSVPGLTTRNFQSTVELREGQTLAVAGLIQNNFGSNATRVPLFGDLPVIGRLFAFDNTSMGDQELVILVTPELVHPLDPGKCPPLPGADVFEPSDIEFYLLGRLTSHYAEDWRSPARMNLDQMLRHRQLEQRFILGPQGHSDGR